MNKVLRRGMRGMVWCACKEARRSQADGKTCNRRFSVLTQKVSTNKNQNASENKVVLVGFSGQLRFLGLPDCHHRASQPVQSRDSLFCLTS